VWLIILAYSAVIATILWYSRAERDVYMFKVLSLILWGAAVMVFVDHVIGYLSEGGDFIEITPDAVVLGFIMLLTALIIWMATLLIKDPRRVLRRISKVD